MTEGGRAETIAKAIRGFGSDKWREARQSEIDRDRIDVAYDATRAAIRALPGDPWLRVPVVAALFNRSETVTFDRLKEFKSDIRYKLGRDFKEAFTILDNPVKSRPGVASTRKGLTLPHWLYRRGAVVEFWETRVRKPSRKPSTAGPLKASPSPTKHPSELEQLRARVDALEKLVRARLSFLTKDGKVFDNADLPQASVPDIKAFLADGGTVEFMTLGEALQEREWFGYGYREAWAVLWKDTLTRAIAGADKMALLSVPVHRKVGREHRSRA